MDDSALVKNKWTQKHLSINKNQKVA
jgi:hypothetical protein